MASSILSSPASADTNAFSAISAAQFNAYRDLLEHCQAAVGTYLVSAFINKFTLEKLAPAGSVQAGHGGFRAENIAVLFALIQSLSKTLLQADRRFIGVAHWSVSATQTEELNKLVHASAEPILASLRQALLENEIDPTNALKRLVDINAGVLADVQMFSELVAVRHMCVIEYLAHRTVEYSEHVDIKNPALVDFNGHAVV